MLFTFFDVETSGLESNCDILSFSYMLADENLDVRRAETLYFWKEGVTKWTEEAYAIHGLSKEFLREYSGDYEKNLQKMYLYLTFSTLVGYNSGWIGADGLIHGFDYDRCRAFLSRNDIPEPRPAGFMDVMKMAEHALHRRVKLGVAFEQFGLSHDIASAINAVYFGSGEGRAHESAYDVIMTALIFQQLYDDGAESSGKVTTWAVDQEKAEKKTEWFLFFAGEELKAMSVVTENDEETVKVFTMAELLDKDIQVFDYLMKNPDLRMCTDGRLIAIATGTYSEGGFVDV